MEIESAIRNLLTNAVRYTPDGGRIDIEWRLRGADGWLTVRDTGIGIAREHLPRLTERFYRVDRGRSRDSGGTGLGLAIVKHIVQRHDGQLVVESQLGQGSAFTLKLPARRLVAAPSPLPAPEAPDESGDPAPQAAEH
jgi:two-component system phosphate regulon sensor histidine kinase PhoR